MKTFAERLKYAMGASGMSQSNLSDRAGISKADISQYLSGKHIPGKDRVNALANATGVSFDYLMGDEATPAKEQDVPVKKITDTVPLPPSTFNPYLVRVNISVLNVRNGPSSSYAITTQIRKNEVYTIVAEENGWGRLKSGAGWIYLGYTVKR